MYVPPDRKYSLCVCCITCVMLCNVMRACCSSLVYSASVELVHPSKAAIPVSVGRLFQPQTSKHLPLRRPLYVHTQYFAQPFAWQDLFLWQYKYLDWLGVSFRNSWIAKRSLRRRPPNPRNGEKVPQSSKRGGKGGQWRDVQMLRCWWKGASKETKFQKS